MAEYKFPTMYFYCDDGSIQRQIDRNASDALAAGGYVSFLGNAYHNFALLMEAVRNHELEIQKRIENQG